MKRKDFNAIISMLLEEWDLGRTSSNSEGEQCAKYYYYKILSNSTNIILSHDENKNLNGFIVFNNKRKKDIITKTKKLINKIKKEKSLLHNMIGDKETLKLFNDLYDKCVPEEIVKDYEGEITLLAVRSNSRNLGLGKKLLNRAIEALKHNGIENVYLFSDDACEYGFYDKLNFEKIFECKVLNGHDELVNKEGFYDDKQYVYLKHLN